MAKIKTVATIKLSGEVLRRVYDILKEERDQAERDMEQYSVTSSEFKDAFKRFDQLDTSCHEIETTY